MKTDAVTAADLGRSVIAVPPLAREAADGAVSAEENRKIVGLARVRRRVARSSMAATPTSITSASPNTARSSTCWRKSRRTMPG